MSSDIRTALRSLAKNPGITVLSVLSMGLGIGLTTGTFSIADALLLRPYPVERPGELRSLMSRSDDGRWVGYGWPDYEDMVAAAPSQLEIAAYTRRISMLSLGEESELMLTSAVSPSYFSLLGVRAAVGRASVEEVDGGPAVVLGHRLWQSRFGRDPAVAGKTVILNKKAFQIAGVMPAEFTGLERGVVTDVWVSTGAWFDVIGDRQERIARSGQFELVARLKPEVQPEHAAVVLDAAIRGEGKHRPAPAGVRGTYLDQRFAPKWTSSLVFGGGLFLLLALVLLIACANVAQLRLAQAENRRKELAVRMALGAKPWRLMRFLLAETSLVAVLGASLGLVLALWVMDLGAQLLSGGSHFLHFSIGLDYRVLAYTVAATLLCVLMAGLAPSRYAVKLEIAEVVRSEQGGLGHRRTWLSRLFLAGQVAASIALFGCALLFLQSFRNAASVRPGLDPGKNLIVFQVAPGPPGGAAWAEQASERLASLPGVRGATFARRLPLSGSGGGATVRVEMPNQPPLAVRFNNVAGNYFAVMGTRVVAGRAIDTRDRVGSELVVVVSQGFARQFFAGRNAVGEWATLRGKARRIVGVAEDGPSNHLHEEPQPYLYLPFAQSPSGDLTLMVETASTAASLMSPLRRELKRFDPLATVFASTTLRQHMYQALSSDRMMTSVSSMLGAFGVLLTAAGLFGVIQYWVSRRTRELGLRMALGAQPAQIRRLVLVESLRVTAAGMPVGFLLLWAAGRYVESMLLGVSPLEPWTYLLSAGAVLAVTLAAAWLPARRATRIAPLEALRLE